MGRLRAKVRRTPLEPDSSTGVEEEIVMRLKGKRVAILAENMYQEMELWVPYYRLKEEGAEVTVADFDAVIIPGGYAPDMMRRSPAMVRLVKDAFVQGKVVAAICHAAWMLCSAGGLKGKTATCSHSIKDDLVNAGARYVDQEVVVDGNLITSREPKDLPAFCREIIKALEKASW